MCQRNGIAVIPWLIGWLDVPLPIVIIQHRGSLWRSDPWILIPQASPQGFFFVSTTEPIVHLQWYIAKKLTKNIQKNARTKLLAFVTSSCTIPFLTQCWCPRLGIQGCLANERWDCYMAYAGERTAFAEKLGGHVQLSLVSVHSQKKHILNYINTMVVNLY